MLAFVISEFRAVVYSKTAEMKCKSLSHQKVSLYIGQSKDIECRLTLIVEVVTKLRVSLLRHSVLVACSVCMLRHQWTA